MNNKFRNITASKPKARSPVVSTKTQEVHTSMGIVDYTPTFSTDEVVKLIPANAGYSTNHKKLCSQNLVVDYCKVKDLGDMVVEILYLKETNEDVCNPYFAEHFKKVD